MMGSVKFAQSFFKQVTQDAKDPTATLNEQLRFDGYTCVQPNQKLYFTSSDYAQAPISISTSSFTIEFWVKLT